jgi:hypothetical protein
LLLCVGVPATAAEFRVNTTTAYYKESPCIAMDAAGNFVIAWTDYGQDGDGDGIYAQRYNNNGAAVGSEFRVNTTTTSDQSDPSVAMG